MRFAPRPRPTDRPTRSALFFLRYLNSFSIHVFSIIAGGLPGQGESAGRDHQSLPRNRLGFRSTVVVVVTVAVVEVAVIHVCRSVGVGR